MGYDFDVRKMPGDMQQLYYQSAAESGDKRKIDSELEYSLFMSRTKKLLESGKASFSADKFNEIFGYIKTYPSETENPVYVKFPKSPLEKLKVKTLDDNDLKRVANNLANFKPDKLTVEQMDSNRYKYEALLGDVAKKDYVIEYGFFNIKDNKIVTRDKTCTLYENGDLEIAETLSGHKSLYDKNSNHIYEEITQDGKPIESCLFEYDNNGNIVCSYFADHKTGYKEVSEYAGKDSKGKPQGKIIGTLPNDSGTTYNNTPRALDINTKRIP